MARTSKVDPGTAGPELVDVAKSGGFKGISHGEIDEEMWGVPFGSQTWQVSLEL